MGTEIEIVEVQVEKKVSSSSILEEDQYEIFGYFKDRTGFLIACVSAFVAIMSFVVRFAIGRMNYAYLEYWNLPTLYANTNNQNEMHLVVCTLLYILAIMLIHALLSKTSSAYRAYNKLQTTMTQQINRAKKLQRKARKEIRICTNLVDKLSPEEKESEATQKVQTDIKKTKEDVIFLQEAIAQERKLRKLVRIWITLNVGGVVLSSFLIGLLFILLIQTTITSEVVVQSSKVVALIILLELMAYFLPAYWSTRCSKKQYENMDIAKFVEEMNPEKIPSFPIDSVTEKGFKSVFSDKQLKKAGAQIAIVTVILLVLMPVLGNMSAKLKEDFPIYTDNSGTYAVVYFSGSTVFMEESTCQDCEIVIDTSKQRIVTTDDLSYNMVSFDNVTVNRMENTQGLNQNTSYLKDLIDDIGAFFEMISARLEKVLAKNEAFIVGTERQPTSGD